MANTGYKSLIISYDQDKNGSLPYDFSQSFPEPITVNPDQSIALYSLDLERDLIVLDEDIDTTLPIDNQGNTYPLTGPGFLIDLVNSDYSYTESSTGNDNIKSIPVQLDKGTYTKSEFLQELLTKTQTQINTFNSTCNLDIQYQPRIVDNGDDSYFGLSSVFRLAPVRLSSIGTPQNNITSRNVSNSDNIYATFRSPNMVPTSNASTGTNTWDTFGFGQSAINTFNNHGSVGRNDAEVENSSMVFSVQCPNNESGEFVVGLWNQCYQIANWSDPTTVATSILRTGGDSFRPGTLVVPKCYIGVHFSVNNDETSPARPYTIITLYTTEQLNHINTTIDGDNNLNRVYRTSTDYAGSSGTAQDRGCVLFRTIQYADESATATDQNSQTFIQNNQFFINVYYRYTTDAYDIDNARFYFQFGTLSTEIGGTSRTSVLFDSKDIELQISKELCKESYKLYNATTPNQEETNNPGVNGVPGGLVPFWACRRITTNTAWASDRTLGWTLNANVNRTGANVGYNTPFGLYSYRINNITPQLQRILGAKEFRAFIPNRRTDLDAELGIVKFFQDGKRYNIIVKSLPLDSNVTSQKGQIGKKQNVIFKLINEFDEEITTAGNRSIVASVYPGVLKFVRLDAKQPITFNNVEIEIRDAATNKIAKEVLDFSCELVIQ